MEPTTIRYEVDEDAVATITLNRPDTRNAATYEMEDELLAAFAAADADPAVRAVVLTGAGRAFCAGDDVKAAWGDPRMAETLAALGGPSPPITPLVAAMLDLDVPTVAAVNGAAVGIGMDLALLCDVRLASEHAKFGQLFVKLGLSADVTGYWLLPQLVGRGVANELLLTGDVVDASTAERLGLVSRVVPADTLLGEAHALAAKIAANPPLAVADDQSRDPPCGRGDAATSSTTSRRTSGIHSHSSSPPRTIGKPRRRSSSVDRRRSSDSDRLGSPPGSLVRAGRGGYRSRATERGARSRRSDSSATPPSSTSRATRSFPTRHRPSCSRRSEPRSSR